MQDLEPAEPTEPAKPKTPEPESEEQREQKAKLQRKEQALQQKDQGNAAYKAKKFDEASSTMTKPMSFMMRISPSSQTGGQLAVSVVVCASQL